MDSSPCREIQETPGRYVAVDAIPSPRGATMNARSNWAEWQHVTKTRFQNISMLTASRYVEITADFARRFATLEGIMSVYKEPEIFNAALSQSFSPWKASPA